MNNENDESVNVISFKNKDIYIKCLNNENNIIK
jgi:hypothetical protein